MRRSPVRTVRTGAPTACPLPRNPPRPPRPVVTARATFRRWAFGAGTGRSRWRGVFRWRPRRRRPCRGRGGPAVTREDAVLDQASAQRIDQPERGVIHSVGRNPRHLAGNEAATGERETLDLHRRALAGTDEAPVLVKQLASTSSGASAGTTLISLCAGATTPPMVFTATSWTVPTTGVRRGFGRAHVGLPWRGPVQGGRCAAAPRSARRRGPGSSWSRAPRS